MARKPIGICMVMRVAYKLNGNTILSRTFMYFVCILCANVIVLVGRTSFFIGRTMYTPCIYCADARNVLYKKSFSLFFQFLLPFFFFLQLRLQPLSTCICFRRFFAYSFSFFTFLAAFFTCFMFSSSAKVQNAKKRRRRKNETCMCGKKGQKLIDIVSARSFVIKTVIIVYTLYRSGTLVYINWLNHYSFHAK